jgi:DNA repair protein RecN (Recombination protein N)
VARTFGPHVIEELRIRGLGVIDDAALELDPGLTVVTGETGAGKTMVVTGLGLLLGVRADTGAVRSGASRAIVEGRLRLAPASAAARLADEAGAETDDGELLVARAVSAEGRSRAWLGGRSVPVGTLAELAAHVVAVHGQSDQLALLAPARQREALDRYAGEVVTTPLAEYGGDYRRLREVEAELVDIRTGAARRAQEADLLRFGLDEVAGIAPEAGEDAVLDAEATRLAHADALREAAQTAHAALLAEPDSSDASDALTLVAGARRALEQVRQHDAELAGLADRLAEIVVLVTQAATDLATYSGGVDSDPLRLAAVQERRAALRTLTRKYGPELSDVLVWAKDSAQRLELLDSDDDRLTGLADEQAVLRSRLSASAAQISAARTAAGARFAAAVSAELAALAMPDARVTVTVDQVDDPAGLDAAAAGLDGRTLRFGPHGVDEVELRLAPHAGAPARALARGASGGELSRVMLAVEVVFSGADPVPTLVFDEVDAGVGGRAAVEVGLRLSRLARVAQVLVVTHLPQVAAFADRHLLVEKASDGAVTRSGVTTLDGDGRIAELTRMLAGLEGSQSGRAHAEELLRAAATAKAG